MLYLQQWSEDTSFEKTYKFTETLLKVNRITSCKVIEGKSRQINTPKCIKNGSESSLDRFGRTCKRTCERTCAWTWGGFLESWPAAAWDLTWNLGRRSSCCWNLKLEQLVVDSGGWVIGLKELRVVIDVLNKAKEMRTDDSATLAR